MSILIAEDERDLRELIRLHLEQEGYSVLCAKDGKEALVLFDINDIELGIFDIMMPNLDGINLMRKIRESSTIPIIMLTAKSDDTDKVISLKLGADDYIVKPFSMAELLARIEAILRRSLQYSRTKEPSVIKSGDLTLDIDAYTLRKRGSIIELNAKELLLLKLFMENPERVFTKKQIYHSVWKDAYLYDDNTVMVHISRLRNKIEDDPGLPNHIKTIKGIGYKFCGERKAD